ncbi:MAG TPA: recombinase family protein [Metabacillus sp.]|nr:recombinase family protein [Metabacillus sp.]
MMIGYARVSSLDQNLGRQKKLLKEYGCKHVVEEKVSGAKRDRSELNKLLNTLRFKDVLVVTELSRLARSLQDLLTILNELREKNVDFVSIKENIDTRKDDIYGKLMLHIMGAIAEFERDLIKQRQREGIAIAKQKGKYKGRPIQYHDAARGKDKLIYDTIISLLKQEVSVMDIHRKTGVSRSTIYRIKRRIK